MGAVLLSGKEVSESMLAKVLADAEMLISKGINPTLAMFRTGHRATLEADADAY